MFQHIVQGTGVGRERIKRLIEMAMKKDGTFPG
jgi:hypothetical protein